MWWWWAPLIPTWEAEAGGKRKGIWPALFVQLETLESVLLKPLNTLVIRSPWSKVEVGSDGAWKRGSELVDVSS